MLYPAELPARCPIIPSTRTPVSIALLALAFLTAPDGLASAEPPALRLTLLGTGNPRPSLSRFGPSTLVEAGNRRLLVDVGRGASTRLFERGGARLLASVDTVLLTHLHSDHVVGLPDLWLTGWLFGRERPLRVIGPPGTRALCDGLRSAFDFDLHSRRDVDEKLPAAGAELDVRELTPGESLSLDDLGITAFAVDHGLVAPAYGYRLDRGGRSVAFSGDTRYSESLITAAAGVDVLLHEVLSAESERRLAQVSDPGRIERIIARHTLPEDAGRVFARVRPRLAVYTHIVPAPARRRDLIRPTRRTWRGPLVVGEDGMSIEIGERVRVTRP